MARLISLSMSTVQDLPSPDTVQEQSHVYGEVGGTWSCEGRGFRESCKLLSWSDGIAPIIQTYHKTPAAASLTLQGITGRVNE